MSSALVAATLLVLLTPAAEGADVATLTVIHFNDFHGRFEPIHPKTKGECKAQDKDICVGGFARLHSKITELKRLEPNALVVNAGDVCTGTLWFGLFKWNITAEFMNLLPVDVQTVGNHEFDLEAVDAVYKYLSLITKTSTVVSNFDTTEEPQLDPFIEKSKIIVKNGLRIGLVGYVTKDYENIATIGKLKIKDEVTATNEEIKKLRAQNEIDIVVAVTHAGYDKDKEVAASLDADIIVGGHSHSFLYTGDLPSTMYDKPAGKYPTVVTQSNGRRVLIVQALAFSKYVGYLKVKFEKKEGRFEVAEFEGNPILLDKTVLTDGSIEAKLVPWRADVERIGSRKVGESLINLDASGWICHFSECSIGRMIADSWIYEYTKLREGRSWTRAAVALLHSGSIRTSIMRGNISFAEVWNAMPFQDLLGMVELNGQHFKELLEFSTENNHLPFLQMSGVKANIDLTKPSGDRVSDIFVRCATCPVPVYEPLIVHKYYRILMLNYMYEGGDGYSIIKKRARFWESGRKDVDVLLDYLENYSPVLVELDDNVQVSAPAPALERIKAALNNKYGQ